MAGYSAKPLVAKLDIRPNHRLLLQGAPEGFLTLLHPLPAGVAVVTARAREADTAILFARLERDLRDRFPRLAARLHSSGLLWVAWPKKAAKVPTDLTEDRVRAIGLAAGLVDVKVCAITEVWSGLKFVRRLKDR